MNSFEDNFCMFKTKCKNDKQIHMATVSWISLHHELFTYVISLQGRIVTMKFSIIYNFKRLKTKTIVFLNADIAIARKT